MIEFKGELTGKSKKFIILKQIKMQTILSLFMTIVFLIPIIFIPALKEIKELIFAYIIIFDVFMLLPPSKNARKNFMPLRIYIDLEEEFIIHECPELERSHSIKSVKKIIDYGEWYYLIFYYSDRDMYFVCQKDLLTQGSIEDFEGLFRDRIVKNDRYVSSKKNTKKNEEHSE